jgi:hypothetical protein
MLSPAWRACFQPQLLRLPKALYHEHHLSTKPLALRSLITHKAHEKYEVFKRKPLRKLWRALS